MNTINTINQALAEKLTTALCSILAEHEQNVTNQVRKEIISLLGPSQETVTVKANGSRLYERRENASQSLYDRIGALDRSLGNQNTGGGETSIEQRIDRLESTMEDVLKRLEVLETSRMPSAIEHFHEHTSDIPENESIGSSMPLPLEDLLREISGGNYYNFRIDDVSLMIP
jgi:hypothetical protein